MAAFSFRLNKIKKQITHRVGSGTGPETVAPVEVAAPMMASPASTMARVSNDLSLMRMDCEGDEPAAAATADGAAARVETDVDLAETADRCARATTGAIFFVGGSLSASG